MNENTVILRVGCQGRSPALSFVLPAMMVSLVWASECRAASYILTVTATHGSVTKDPEKESYDAGERVHLIPRPDVGYSFRDWAGDIISNRHVAVVTMDGNKSVTANFGTWEPPLGVPTPPFGIFETYRLYDDPSKQNPALTYNASSDGGFYTHYIDNTDPNATDTANPCGTKAKPRRTVPQTELPAGSIVEIHGGTTAQPYQYGGLSGGYYLAWIWGAGTAAQPIFVRGATNGWPVFNGMRLRLAQSYIVMEDLDLTDCTTGANAGHPDTNHMVWRNLRVHGGRNISTTAINPGGTNDNYNVIYANHIYQNADPNYPTEMDFHGVSTGGSNGKHTEQIWIVDNVLHENGGDSVQVNSTATDLAHNIYIGRNIMYEEGENAVDLKQCQSVIVTQNTAWAMTDAPGSDGTAIVLNDDSPRYNIWVLFNYVSHSLGGIRVNGNNNNSAYILGNVVWDIHDATHTGSGIIGYSQSGIVYIIGNSVYDADRGIAWGSNTAGAGPSALRIYNNIVQDTYTSGDGSHLQIKVSSVSSGSVMDNCVFYQTGGSARIFWGSTTLVETLAAFQARTGLSSACVDRAPLFVDAAAGNFRLQSASPAIDRGAFSGPVQEVFDAFQTLYGLDIGKDIEGRARPQGLSWDIGAYEYPSGSSPDTAAPENVNGLTATPADAQVTLSWTNPSDADFAGVRILRKTGSAPTGPTDGTVIHQGTGTSQVDAGLTNGTTYYYRVFAYDEVLNYSTGVTASGTPAAGVDTTAPGNVTGFTVTPGDGQITLRWTNPSDADFAGVRILRKTGSAPTGPSDGTVAYQGTGTSQVDTGLTNGTTYYYQAFAYDEVPNYSAGVAASGTPVAGADSTAPGNVTGFTVTPGDGQITLRWTNPSDADFAGIRILRKTGSAPTGPSDGTVAYQGTGTSQVDAGLTNGTTYYYQAFAYDAVPNYSAGVAASGTPAAPGDTTAPQVSSSYPAADAIQVPLNPVIALTISDSGSGVDASTVAIRVHNQLVYSGDSSLYESAYGTCRRTGTRASYSYYYSPAKAFDFDQQVAIQVNASDAAHNAMTPVSYQFLTEMRSFGRNQVVNSSGDSSGHPAVATDSQGNSWAVWHAGPADARDVYVAKRGPTLQQWDAPVRLTNLASDQCNPALAVGPDDKLYVVWQDNRRGNWDIYVSVSSDGSTWGDPVRVTDSNDNQMNPVVAVDQASPSDVYIAWERGSAGSRDIYLASSNTSFVSKTITQVTSNPADQMEPALAVGADNTVYLAWTDQRNGTADIYGSSSAASSWANVPFATGPGNQSHPAVAVEPDTAILHVLWVDDAAGNLDVVHGSSNALPGSPISGTTIVDDTTHADQGVPAIVATKDYWNNTHVYACWQDHRAVGSAHDTDLYFAEIQSGAAGTNVLVGDDGTNSEQSDPALGYDAYGQPMVVWTDSRGGTPRIYNACSVYMTPVPVASALITRAAGGRVGVDPASIDDVGDVSIQIPPWAYDCDVAISISGVQNLPRFASASIAGYEIGPSGLQFAFPATVTIPYTSSGSGQRTPYWYDTQTGTLSQQGITDITYRTLANGIPVVSFKTTHLTPFYILESPVAVAGGGGGGCAMSGSREGSVVGFLLPYTILVLLLLILKWRDCRHKRI